MSVFLRFFSLIIILYFQSLGLAVTTTYVSADDGDITLKSVVMTTGKDNVQGIFAKPLSEELLKIVESEHFFEVPQAPLEGDFDLDDLRANPKQVNALVTKAGTDGLLHLQISKGQIGLRMELGLFTRTSGLLWAYSEFVEKQKFDHDYLRGTIKIMYEQIINQLPYQGLVLSRSGSKVTVNRGTSAGLRPDQEINVIQVLSVKRHPQFQFVTHVEKQIVGKIRLIKTDETLSFGHILFEQEPQVIQPGLKLLLREPVSYPNLVLSQNEGVIDHLMGRPDAEVMMKGDAKEWLPQSVPTFARVHALLGWGEFNTTTNLATSGSQEGLTSFALNAQFDADLWINRTWFIRAGINQGSAQVKNPLSGSAPTRLNYSIQSTKLALGYDFEVASSIYGPRIQALLGVSQFHAKVTESNPTSFTTTDYNSNVVGLVGYMPVDDLSPKWGLGAEIWYHLSPSVTEKPVTSGDPENLYLSQIAGSVYYNWTPNLYWIFRLSIDSARSDFSGTGTRLGEMATSTEINWRRIDVGVEYLF
jgi:hypothetical protein